MKASAYLSVFDDFELLGPAMASIVPPGPSPVRRQAALDQGPIG
jgi:hypothetical protein